MSESKIVILSLIGSDRTGADCWLLMLKVGADVVWTKKLVNGFMVADLYSVWVYVMPSGFGIVANGGVSVLLVGKKYG